MSAEVNDPRDPVHDDPNGAPPGSPTAAPPRQAATIEFVTLFLRAFKTRSVHAWQNRAAIKQMTHLMSTIETVLEDRDEVSVEAHEHNLFVDSDRVRVSSKGFELVRTFADVLDDRGIGGLRIRSGIQDAHLRRLIDLLIERDDRKCYAAIVRALADESVGTISMLPRRRLRWVRGETERIDSRTFLIRTYAKLPMVLRQYTQALDDEAATLRNSVTAQRVVQDLVDISYHVPERMLGLVNIKLESDPFFHHSANVAVLSILMGHQVGLAKAELGDLGYAALFHDIGKAFMPGAVHVLAGMPEAAGVPSSPGEDSPDLRNHHLRATQHFLGYPRFAESHVRRLLATYHRGLEQNLGTQGGGERAGGQLFGRIIAIVDAFDRLTTDRPTIPALLPDEALQRLWNDRGRCYDSSLLKAFVQLVGLVPIGTVVELDSGEIGVVIGSHVEGELADRPLLIRVQDEAGLPVEGPVLDLAERAEGAFTRSIVCRRSARELGINVPAVLLG